MGYYTYHTLTAKSKTLTPELIEEINEWLAKRQVIDYALRKGEYCGECAETCERWSEWEDAGECSWYEHREDMEALSKAFPDITFCLHGEGDSREDVWDEYWLNGDCERCQAVLEIPEPTRIKW